MTTKPRGRLADFLSIFNCPYPFNICTKLESYYFSGFGGLVNEKIFFFFLILPWKPNKILTGHERHKLGRPSSNVITAKYGSHHFTGYEENAISPFSHYISLQELSVAMDHHNFSHFELSLPQSSSFVQN